jgi:hypothetical protein
MLRSILAEDIRDNRFLRLIDGLLQARATRKVVLAGQRLFD